jgi:hypothetical protein
MAVDLSSAALERLSSDAVATVVTLDPDGTPHLGVVHVTVERVSGIGPWRA